MAKIALLGGTGREGRGLALRFALAGEQVIVGSRSGERAESSARALSQRCGSGCRPILAATNADAARQADVACLCVPAAGISATLAEVGASLRGKILIEVVNPVVHTPAGFEIMRLDAPSAAEWTAMLLPDADVVSAFKTISARHLLDAPQPIEGDVFVCSDVPPAKRFTIDLIARIPQLRAVDCGPLRNARCVEAATALLLELNRIHGATTSLRILDLPDAAPRRVIGKR